MAIDAMLEYVLLQHLEHAPLTRAELVQGTYVKRRRRAQRHRGGGNTWSATGEAAAAEVPAAAGAWDYFAWSWMSNSRDSS